MGMCREEFAALVVERLREGTETVNGKGRITDCCGVWPKESWRASEPRNGLIVATKKNLQYIEESLCPPVFLQDVNDLLC